MAANRNTKNAWVLFLLILTGIVLGSFMGDLAKEIDFLNWLNFGKTFGMETPLAVDLQVIFFQIQLKFYISISSILGVVLALFVYRKI